MKLKVFLVNLAALIIMGTQTTYGIDNVNVVTIFTPESENAFTLGTAVTHGFAKAIEEQQIIIADFDAYRNLYVMSEHPYMLTGAFGLQGYEKMKQTPQLPYIKIWHQALSNNWRVYSTNDQQFLLFIPPQKALQPLPTLGFAALKPMDIETLKKTADHNFMEEIRIATSINSFAQLFNPSSSVRKRFFLIGHGTPGIIAGLDIKYYQSLLMLLNTLSVDLLTVLSCFAGGDQLLSYYQQQANGASKIILNYTIVVAGLSNNSVEWHDKSFKTFFDNLNNFLGFGNNQTITQFKQWLKPLGLTLTATPSIRFPGTDFFRVIDVDNKVEALTYNAVKKYKLQQTMYTAKTYEELEKAYKILPKEQFAAVLARQVPTQQLLKILTEKFKTLPKELITEVLLAQQAATKNPLNILTIAAHKSAILLYPSVLDLAISVDQQAQFPLLVSMLPGPSRHLITTLDAQHFSLDQILDGFMLKHLNISAYINPETIFIKKLTCKVLINNKSQVVTLENVILYREKPLTLQEAQPGMLFSMNDMYFTYDSKKKIVYPFTQSAPQFIAGLLARTKPDDNLIKVWSANQDSNQIFEQALWSTFGLIAPAPVMATPIEEIPTTSTMEFEELN